MSDSADSKNWSFDTKVLHAGQEHEQWSNSEIIPPIVTSMTFHQEEPCEMRVGSV